MLSSLILLSKYRLIISICITATVSYFLALKSIDMYGRLLLVCVILFFSGISSAFINNLLDIHIDKKMDRTQSRIVAINKVGTTFLWSLALALFLVSLILSIIFFNVYFTSLLILCFISYVLLYTLYLKRQYHFGTVLGGLPGALPVLIAQYSVTSQFLVENFMLFLYMMLWQPPHFWILALSKNNDYSNANIPTLPNTLGLPLTKIYISIYLVSLTPLVLLICLLANFHPLYYILNLSLGIAYLVYTIYLVEHKNYKLAFSLSIIYLMLTFFLIFLGVLYL